MDDIKEKINFAKDKVEGYDNEGFLYINNRHGSQNKEDDNITFKKGLICDSDGNLVCLGEIVPIVASTLNLAFSDYMLDIKYWMPIIRGIKIRIYWCEFANMFNISSAGKIYPTDSTLFISKETLLEQINFELLDKTMCYYAIIENSEQDKQKIILTHTAKNRVETTQLGIENTLNALNEPAFKWHTELTLCETNTDVFKILTKEKSKHKYGVAFINAQGDSIEFASKIYEKIRMLEKPDYIDYVEYYCHALNKHPQENQTIFDHYFENDLHYDINNELLAYFPEYKPYFDTYKKKLKEYIESIINESSEEEEEEAEKVFEESEYIEVYYEITKSSINPIYSDKTKEETETIDLKRIQFARNLIEKSKIEDLIRILV